MRQESIKINIDAEVNIVMGSDDASEKLKSWIKQHSDVLKNIWEDESYEDKTPLQENCQVIDPIQGRETEFCSSVRKFGGDTLYTWDNGDTFSGQLVAGVREGWGVVTSRESGVHILSGHWSAGLLTGYGQLVMSEDAGIVQGWFRGGCLHGLVRKMIVKKFRTFTQQVSWLGRYHSGVARGQCWEWREGGGYITGQVDSRGRFTGDNIAFVYPDMSTAILGRYNDGVLVSGAPATVAEVTLEQDIAVVRWSITVSPGHLTSVEYFKSTEDSVGPQPLVSDPYEDRTVDVRQSGVGGGGEGLYARRRLVKGEITAFYNGVIIKKLLLTKFLHNFMF